MRDVTLAEIKAKESLGSNDERIEFFIDRLKRENGPLYFYIMECLVGIEANGVDKMLKKIFVPILWLTDLPIVNARDIMNFQIEVSAAYGEPIEFAPDEIKRKIEAKIVESFEKRISNQNQTFWCYALLTVRLNENNIILQNQLILALLKTLYIIECANEEQG